MPERLACPGCGRRVRVPDELIGQPVQCPACKSIFTSEDADEAPPPRAEKPAPRRGPKPPPLPEEEDDLEVEASDEPEEPEEPTDGRDGAPRRRRRRRPYNVEAWKSVRSGLGRIVAACITMIATWSIVLLIYGIGFAVGMSVLDPTAAMVIWGAALATLVVGTIAVFSLQFLGLGECREAPQRNGCHKLATVSYNLLVGCVIAGVISLIFSVLSMVFLAGGVIVALPIIGMLSFLCSSIMGLLGLASVVVFIFFMRAVSQTVKSPSQASNCLFLAIASLLVFPLSCTGLGGLVFVPSLSSGPIAVLPICCGLGGNLLPLAVGVWYIITIFMVRNAIQDYLSGEV